MPACDPVTGAPYLGASAYEAGVDARRLTEELITLVKSVNDFDQKNPDGFPKAYRNALVQFVKSWQDFVTNVSGQNFAWFNLPGKLSTSIAIRWYGPEIYNTVQDYRGRYNQLWALASKVMKADATPVKPEDPKPKVSTSPITDAVSTLVKGALLIGGIGVGIYVFKSMNSSKS